jgi:PmbA protein
VPEANSNLDIACGLVDLARRAGAEQCDVFLVQYDESHLAVRLGEVEKLIEAGSRSLGLRVINGGRTAVSSTSDLSREALEALARETVELANISAADEHAGLPETGLLARGGMDGLQLYDERLGDLTAEEKLRMALACEDAALKFDPRITNSDGASLSTRSGEVALANSLGFAASYPATSVSLVVEVMADDAEGKKRNAYWYSAARSLHRLAEPEEVGRRAAQRAVAQLGAKKVATKRVPVVFEPMMTAGLMRDISACTNGSALYHGSTFLADRAGDRVGSELVNIVDDPTEPGRGGSRPFDAEGVPARRNALFEEGVFRGFLFDVYSARRTGNRTTGSADRSIASLPAPGTSNLVFLPGGQPPEDIVAGVRDGLYLTALLGHGFNPATGDYSRGAAGFWIEDGAIAYPVTEVNVSGRMAEMLAAVDAAGSDLEWFGSSAAPTIRVAEMMVSGL